MLAKITASIGFVFILSVFFLIFVNLLAFMAQFFILQNKTQFAVTHMGKVGGYTQEIDDKLNAFFDARNVPDADVKVLTVSASPPLNWGEIVTINILWRYHIRIPVIGKTVEITMPVIARGQAVSSFISGSIAEPNYISPTL